VSISRRSLSVEQSLPGLAREVRHDHLVIDPVNVVARPPQRDVAGLRIEERVRRPRSPSRGLPDAPRIHDHGSVGLRDVLNVRVAEEHS